MMNADSDFYLPPYNSSRFSAFSFSNFCFSPALFPRTIATQVTSDEEALKKWDDRV